MPFIEFDNLRYGSHHIRDGYVHIYENTSPPLIEIISHDENPDDVYLEATISLSAYDIAPAEGNVLLSSRDAHGLLAEINVVGGILAEHVYGPYGSTAYEAALLIR